MPRGEHCRRCGAELTGLKRYCPRCGTLQERPRYRNMAAPTGGVNPPGWYKDPFEHQPYRYWDGQLWTSRVYGGTYGTDVVSIDARRDERLPDGAWRATPGSLALTVTGLVVSFGLSIVFVLPLLFLNHLGGPIALLVVSEAGLWTGFFGTCFVTSRRYGTGSIRNDFRLRFRWIDLAIGLGASIVARCLSIVVLIPFAHELHAVGNPDQSLYSVTSLGASGWLILGLVTCVGAPFFEEMFFRGLLQSQLVERWGPAAAIAVTSVVFGAAHIANDPGVAGLLLGLSVGAAGVVLGVIRHMTNRLGSSMLSHALFNGGALLLLAFVSST